MSARCSKDALQNDLDVIYEACKYGLIQSNFNNRSENVTNFIVELVALCKSLGIVVSREREKERK